MKRYLRIYLIGIVATFVLAIAANDGKFIYDTGFMFGLCNLLLGGLLLLVGVIIFIAGSREMARAMFAAAGLILLTGGVACSFFPFNLGPH